MSQHILNIFSTNNVNHLSDPPPRTHYPVTQYPETLFIDSCLLNNSICGNDPLLRKLDVTDGEAGAQAAVSIQVRDDG